jgi:hypothetical protein
MNGRGRKRRIFSGAKARFCVSSNVGAPFVPQGKKARPLRCIYELTWLCCQTEPDDFWSQVKFGAN